MLSKHQQPKRLCVCVKTDVEPLWGSQRTGGPATREHDTVVPGPAQNALQMLLA